MSEHLADQPGNFSENALTLLVGDEGGVGWGLRLDAATGLPSLDAVVERPPTPAGGWPEGTVMMDERPVLPLGRVIQTARPSRQSGVAPSRRPVQARGPRRGPSRARRSRPTRRTHAASRDGPSDSTEGDGEGPPSPCHGDLASGLGLCVSRSAESRLPLSLGAPLEQGPAR